LHVGASVFCFCFLIFTPVIADEVTIAALGDSLTQGYGLPEEDGFVPQLQSWLTGQGNEVRLINAGVSGDTTAGGLARIAWTLSDDVDGLIVALGGNDLLRGLPPSESRNNLDALLRVATDRKIPVLLIGMPAPSNYGPDYKTEFDAIFPDLSQRHDTLLATDFLAAIRSVGGPAEMAEFLQSDQLHPNAEGVARIVADLGPHVQALIARVR